MSHHMESINRLRTNDLELGATDAVARHISRNVAPPKPVSQRQLDFERRRPRWLREMMAEATGVFVSSYASRCLSNVLTIFQFYVYPGVAATASFILNNTQAGYGSLFQIGCAFAMGISFAIIICAPTSGGHFNPAFTICFAIWQGFPWKKVPYYIFAQLVGSFLAALVVAGQYWVQLSAYAAETIASGNGTVFLGGPASIFCAIPKPDQTNLGFLFMIEFFVDSFIALVVWAALDRANPFVSASTAPFIIGLAYGTMVWGFADITISTNLARDLGTRAAAAIFYGGEVFSYHNYSWVGILVNVPATIFATAYYELVFRDSLQKIGKRLAPHEGGEEGLALHLTKTGISMEKGATEAAADGYYSH